MGARADPRAPFLDGGPEAHTLQMAHRVRRQIDAGADLAQRGRLLINRNAQALRDQRIGGEQAADAASDDHDVGPRLRHHIAFSRQFAYTISTAAGNGADKDHERRECQLRRDRDRRRHRRASSPPTAPRELGKRVVVLEKGTEEKYLCNSRYTYGTFHINFTDVGADEDALFGKIEACSEGFARKDLARAIAKDGRRLMQWLKSEGIDLVNLGGYQTNVLAPPWRKGFGLTWQGYAGDVALAAARGETFGKRQGRMLRGTRARALKLAAGGNRAATRPKARPNSAPPPW